jgi:serine/threonine protein kinase
MTEMNKFEAMINGEPEKRVGDLVGNYRLMRWLGRGAFADIYLGEHLYLKTQSAIKMLHVQLSDKALKNFLNEARAIAQLEHPHIVSVLDYGEEDGIPFLVMTYAANGSLRQHFPEGTRVSLEQIVPLVQQMASALDYAHQHKLIHRDVKPENMLVGAQDQVLLSDFGFVLVTQGAHTQVSNSMVGTVLYMAPEQLEGKIHFASDQYALGIVTYEWLCGQCPFTGSYIQVGTQHLSVPPPSLCERVPGLPPSVEHVVFRALAKDRAQRYETVTAFANALQDASKDAISIPTTILSPQLPTSLSKMPTQPAKALPQTAETSREPAEALPQAAEMLTSPEAARSTQPSQSPRDIWQVMLLVIAIVAVIGSGVRLWYNITSSHVSTRSTASTTIKGISVTQPTMLASPITTVHLTPQVISTPSAKATPQVISNPPAKATPQVISNPPAKATPQVISNPPPVVLHIRTIDDSVQGTGTDQFNYVGNGWGHCTSCNGNMDPPNAYDDSNSWDNTINDYVTIAFNGTQIKFYGVVGPPHGIGAFSIDGGSETMVDFYSPTEAGDTLLYTSPMLPSGQHTLQVRVTGNQSSNATWNGINPDRVDILS